MIGKTTAICSALSVPIRAEPGKPARCDYEYVRNGTANVFMFIDVNQPWRHAKVTDQRTCIDFAEGQTSDRVAHKQRIGPAVATGSR